MDQPYGGGDMFETSLFLVFCNRAAAVIFCVCMLVARRESLMWPQGVAWYIFIPSILVISFSNVFASTCQYEALKYVSFPVQMLGKSFKMMPVMLWGMVISNKSYKLIDWLTALAVTGGVVEFLMTGPISSSSEQGTQFKGLLLLLCFLALDGITSPMQERLFKTYEVSKYSQMLYVNSFSLIVSLSTLFGSGGFGSAMSFIQIHPKLLLDATYLSATAVSGQWFIYSLISYAGALPFAAVMNVRQMTSILFSYAVNGHVITLLQMVGLGMVFAALFYKSYVNLQATKDAGEKSALIDKESKVTA